MKEKNEQKNFVNSKEEKIKKRINEKQQENTWVKKTIRQLIKS